MAREGSQKETYTIFNPGQANLNSGIVSPVHTHSDGTIPHCCVSYHDSKGNVAAKLKHITPEEGAYLKLVKDQK